MPAPALASLLALLTALSAWRARALTASGAAAAALTGALILGLGGWAWAAALLAFFVSSSAISRLFTRRKAAAAAKYAKGERRDWGQVAANGGLAAGLAIAHALGAGWAWHAALGALAAANADTWATELGVLNRGAPRLITSGRRVAAGTSGGVSPLGIAASLGGAALIGLVGFLSEGQAALWGAVTLAGLLGSLGDSWLGATVQAVYFCPAEQQETEQHPVHACGAATVHRRGLRWLGNDLVNFAASSVGAVSALAILAIWRIL
jgi:uncharacterized protein (TIGR00297 family)